MTIRSPIAAPKSRTAALCSAVAVLIVGVVTLSLVEIGPLSLQMARHLAAMNVAAPLAAVVTCSWSAGRVMTPCHDVPARHSVGRSPSGSAIKRSG